MPLIAINSGAELHAFMWSSDSAFKRWSQPRAGSAAILLFEPHQVDIDVSLDFVT